VLPVLTANLKMPSQLERNKPKVVSIATVDTATNDQLESLYYSILETSDSVAVSASNRKMLTNCIKTSYIYTKLQPLSPILEVLFCFDGQSNFLCSFVELSATAHQIALPKDIVSAYSGKILSFEDKKKVLYQMHIGEKLHDVADVPWWALTLPQMIAVAQERLGNIVDTKVRALSYPQTWLATKLKSGIEFKQQFGTPANFDYALFAFSIKTPLDCSWSCMKSDENKEYVSQVKTLFTKMQLPPHTLLRPIPKIFSQNSASQKSGPNNKVGNEQIITKSPASAKTLSTFQIDLESDFSLVPSILKKDLHVIQEDSGMLCCHCQKECKQELLTCGYCELKVHYKCYDSQTTTTPTTAKKSGETKKKPMADSTYKNICKIENLHWLCNSCDSPSLLNHILDLASVKVKARIAELTQKDGEYTTVSRKDVDMQTTIDPYRQLSDSFSIDDSAPTEHISALSDTYDNLSIVCRESDSIFSNSLSLRPIESNTNLEDSIIKTPDLNPTVHQEICRPILASTPERNDGGNNETIQVDSQDKLVCIKEMVDPLTLYSNISSSEQNVHINRTLSDQVDVLASQHSAICSIERSMSQMKAEIKDLRESEMEHFAYLKRTLTESMGDLIGKRLPLINKVYSDPQANSRMDEAICTLHNITEENKTILKEINRVEFKRTAIGHQDASTRHTNPDLFSAVAADRTYEGKQYYMHQPTETTVDDSVTVLISRGLSRNYLKNSATIKRNFNKYYKDMAINSTFVTKGGSLMIELTSKEDALKVEGSWKGDFFANSNMTTECRILEKLSWAVILKGVPTNIPDSDLTISVEKSYPGARAKRFVTRDNIYLKTVKINFQTKEDYEKCLGNGLKLGQEIYTAEEYKPRRRIIQCYNCYRFGHVAKLCIQNHATCSKCGDNHPSYQCKSNRRDYCINCDVFGHVATNRDCSTYQNIVMKLNMQPNKCSKSPTQHNSRL